MPGIRQGDVLPATRRDVELRTGDGLVLVGELALPLEHPPVATLVCFHPLPTHGGSMDSHLLKKASFRLPHQAGLAVLRFNTRGTASQRGTSEGAFDHAEGERHDVVAALDLVDRPAAIESIRQLQDHRSRLATDTRSHTRRVAL